MANAGVGPEGECAVADGEDVGEDLVGGDAAVFFEKSTAFGGDFREISGVPGGFGCAVDLGLALKDWGVMVAFPFC